MSVASCGRGHVHCYCAPPVVSGNSPKAKYIRTHIYIYIVNALNNSPMYSMKHENISVLLSLSNILSCLERKPVNGHVES